MSPDDYIVIDKTLYLTRCGILFRIYNKHKTDKYGLCCKKLGSSRRTYIYYTVTHTKNSVEVNENHIKDTLTLVKGTVTGYEQHGNSLKGTKISMDRYYTSIILAECLYEKNITSIEMLNSN